MLRTKKKLSIVSETLRTLSSDQLVAVDGGNAAPAISGFKLCDQVSRWVCPPQTSICSVVGGCTK